MELKLNLRAPKITKNQENWALKKHRKTTLQQTGYWSTFTSKVISPFRPGNVSKITKIRDIFKMGSQASKMSPRALKSLKIMNLTTQNQENPRKKNQENPRKKEGTVAGYARSALDIYIYIYIKKYVLSSVWLKWLPFTQKYAY